MVAADAGVYARTAEDGRVVGFRLRFQSNRNGISVKDARFSAVV